MTIHSVLIQKLLSTNAHLGRRVAAHHFKVYTYGIRNGMTIIDSDKTLICLRNACDFIGSLVRQKGRFLFVNTNALFDEIVDQMTEKIGCKTNKALWRLGGFLTNSSSPKKFRSRNKKICFTPSQLPDCVVIMDTESKSSVILEADRLQIPIVSLVDSSMPLDAYKRITYPVPANDSVQFVYLFCNLITKTFLLEQKRFAASSNAAREETVNTTHQLTPAESESREEVHVQQIEQSKINSARDEVLVVPYESLVSTTDDLVETKKLLDKLVVLNFNGSLGTEMGFDGPKSAITICNGLTFLDQTVNQIESLNSKYDCNIPLLLMNTAETHNDTLKVLEKHSKSKIDILTFSLSQSAKKSLEGQNNGNRWRHADHGEVLLSLMNSGTLDVLLSQGREYILVVSSENLAAVVDTKILNHLVQNRIEYCMELIPTTSLESTAVNSHVGKFQLGEIACSPTYQSMEKFKLAGTKNLWVNLNAIKRLVEMDALKIDIDPASKDVGSGKVLLQETAAGSAIRFFDRAIGINVPKSRYLPLRATSDLLLFQSDLYTSSEGLLIRNEGRTIPGNPKIELGPKFEKVSDFLSRFKSVPSIIELDSLKVVGDVWFGTNVTLKGQVSILAKSGMRLEIPDGAVLENKVVTGPEDI